MSKSIDGAGLLDDVQLFLSRFVVYPTVHALVAHVLWIAHTHRMDIWESTPRIAFLSPEPGSGKSRALEVTELLVPTPIHAVNATPAYLFRKVASDDGLPTVLFDEIDTVFGPKAKDNEELRGLLNAGHRKGNKAGRCVVRGNVITTEELDAYCAVAMAGLHDLPDTIMSRSVVVNMRRRAAGEHVEPFRMRLHRDAGHELRDSLELWSKVLKAGTWPALPEQIQDRNADVWEALITVADAAGGHWPDTARRSAVALVAAKSDDKRSMNVQLLSDLADIFTTHGTTRMTTTDILKQLNGLELSPWSTLKAGPLNANGLARRLNEYGARSKDIRFHHEVLKGYEATDLLDAWSRYSQDKLPAIQQFLKGATSATTQQEPELELELELELVPIQEPKPQPPAADIIQMPAQKYEWPSTDELERMGAEFEALAEGDW